MMPARLDYEGAGRQAKRIAAIDKTSEFAKKAAGATEALAGAKGLPTFGLPTRAAEMVSKSRQKEAAQRDFNLLQKQLIENRQMGTTRLSDLLPSMPSGNVPRLPPSGKGNQ
jgi:hypothetical protein